MIFVKEKFSMGEEGYTTSYITIFDYEEFKDTFKNTIVYNVVANANMGLLRINTIFLYLKYRNDIGVESESYYHIVSDNKDDYKKIKKLIHSKVTISYINEKHFNDYMRNLYPEIVKDYTYDNFCKELDSFDKVVDYNWKFFDTDERVKLVKYALGLDYQDDSFSNVIYSEIRDRINMMEINSQIDYDILGSIIKDGATRVYNNLNNDFEKWREEDMIETIYNRRKEAHILTPKIKSIYANEEKRTIIVKWHTGETTKVTCHESDTWDLEKGIMACITKYVLGNNYNAYTMLDKYIKSVKYSNKK